MSKVVMPTKGGDFTPAPAGLHSAICVDVVDLGWKDTPWGKTPKISVVWQIDKLLEIDGKKKRFLVSSWYTMSLHKKANLRKMIESWFGVGMDEKKIEEQGGFDLDKLIGQRAALTIGHVENKEGEIRAVVNAVSPLPEGMTRLTLDDSYTRKENRDDWQEPSPSAFGTAPEPDSFGDSDVPPPSDDTRDYSDGNPDDDIPF